MDYDKYGALLILKSQMNHNSCDIPHTNTIDMMVYAYTVTSHKLWLHATLYWSEFLTCDHLTALIKWAFGSEHF